MVEYKKLEDRPYHSEYLFHDCVIDAPVAQLWPHVLNIGGWMSAHELKTIDGAPGAPGHFERVYPRNLAPDTPEPRYHLYGIAAVVPHKMVALEVFPEAGGSYGNPANKTSFDTILLTDLGGRTQVGFLMIDVLLDRSGDGRLHNEPAAEREARLKALLDVYFNNLRRLALGAAATA